MYVDIVVVTCGDCYVRECVGCVNRCVIAVVRDVVVLRLPLDMFVGVLLPLMFVASGSVVIYNGADIVVCGSVMLLQLRVVCVLFGIVVTTGVTVAYTNYVICIGVGIVSCCIYVVGYSTYFVVVYCVVVRCSGVAVYGWLLLLIIAMVFMLLLLTFIAVMPFML